MRRSYDPRMQAYDNQTGQARVLYMLMMAIAVAFGFFLWQLSAAPEAPRVEAPAGPYKIEPRAPPPPAAIQPAATPAPAVVEERPPVIEFNPQPDAPEAAQFAPNGRFVAQLASLQSPGAAETAWARITARAPNLFAGAEMDVAVADLGSRGVYHRVRAGYFATRDEAAAFCDQVQRLGQDCIAAAR